MGYDVHITRKANASDEPGADIALEEWRRYVAADPEMRLDGHAEGNLASGGALRVSDPGLAVWTGHPAHVTGSGKIWIGWSQGTIDAKNPDQATLRKMWRIAQALSARLQGDAGETYDSNGDAVAASG